MDVIRCEELVKSQGARKTINGLSFHIKENTITGLVGPNGAGKTTLMKMIAGYWKADGGSIRVFDEKPFDSLKVSANTVYTSDEMNFMDTLTLMEILRSAGNFYEKWDMDLAKNLFDYFAFDPSQIYQNLSKGKKGAFHMIFALASRCALTLMDEPTTGMDKSVRNDFYRALLKDFLAYPRTIIISSHYLDEMENLLEDVLLIDNGKKRLHVPIDDAKTYAIALEGESEILLPWAKQKHVLSKKDVSKRQVTMVIENDLTPYELEDVKRAGITVQPVTAGEFCVHLTSDRDRRIDDVFNNR